MSAGTTNDRSVLDPDVDDQAQATPVEPGAPTPDISKTASAIGTVHARSIGITVLTILALVYTLSNARDFLLPIVMAVNAMASGPSTASAPAGSILTPAASSRLTRSTSLGKRRCIHTVATMTSSPSAASAIGSATTRRNTSKARYPR